MRNIKLTVAYDGSDFHGWQIQPGQPTIQGALTDLAERISTERLTLYGAGRTDAGVHAWGQVVNFQTESRLEPCEWQRALNALLPPSIRVRAAEQAAPDFHARRQAHAKTYRYGIARGPVLSPFHWRYALHDPHPLDFAAMAQAARLFEGRHDFTTFAASSGSEEEDRGRTTQRTIFRSELIRGEETAAEPDRDDSPGLFVSAPRGAADRAPRGLPGNPPEGATVSAQENAEWVYVVRGRSFLRYMVRKIVGTLLEVGRGRLAPADVPRLLELRDPSASGPTVPAHGLCLMSVEYPP